MIDTANPMPHKKHNLQPTTSGFGVDMANNNKEQIQSERRSQIQGSEITIDGAYIADGLFSSSF